MILFLVALLSVDVSSNAPTVEKVGLELRTSCGPRAVWIFANQLGFDLDANKVSVEFGDCSKGTSLAQLSEYLQEKSISCEMLQINPSELSSELCPQIAYLVPDASNDKLGHFVVITDVDEQGVTILEPIVAEEQRWSWGFFSDRWTGHSILYQGNPNRTSNFVIGLASLNIAGAFVIIFRFLRASGNQDV